MLCIRKRKDKTNDPQLVSSSAPLLGAQDIADPQVVFGEFNAKFTNFDPDEEATIINSLTYLRLMPFWYYFVAPVLTICTGLIFGLVLFWFPHLRAWMFYKKVKVIEEATHILVDGRMTEDAEVLPLFAGEMNSVAKDTFTFRFINFQFDYNGQCFNPVQFDVQMTYGRILDQYRHGISVGEVEQARYKFGPCQLLVPMKSIPRLLVDEILNPFYIFQVFSMILWFSDGYEKYACCILAVSLFGVLESLVETVSNYKSIQKMAKYECQVQVKRWNEQPGDNSSLPTISSEELVPGDVIVVPNNCAMPCDAVLLTGSCIVNESMLTGESVPVRKIAIEPENNIYDPLDFDNAKKNTLYGGTKVIQTRLNRGDEHVFALVTRTGFITTKGSLVRDILYPRATKFKFYRDSLIFVGIMALFSIIGFICLLPRLIAIKTEPLVLLDKALDLITICVPPALPATMSAGVAFAVQRLKKKQIFCISPPRVNISGRIQIMVFDKTGTLTEDGLQIIGIRGTEIQRLKGAIQSIEASTSSKGSFNTGICFTQFVPSIQNIIQLDGNNLILNESMASCHSITQVNQELVGDPLEIKMFQLTSWELDEGDQGDQQSFSADILAQVRPKNDGRDSSRNVSIIRRFDFESKLQRMSVLVQNQKDQGIWVHLKGSPEKVQDLCLPHTLPTDFQEILDLYTVKGYRVIALASKFIDSSYSMQDLKSLPRESFESDLIFLGIIVMENKLKEETQPTISTLNECNIRTIMATGDNTLTAISVGSSCNILKDGQTVFFGDLGENNQIIWKNSRLLVQQDQVTDAVESESNKDIQDIEKEMVLSVLNPYTDVPWDQTSSNNFGVALNGKLLNFLSTNREQYRIALNKILSKAQVYARMSPEDKADLVDLLQQTMQVQVGMCGDGANDCGALKQADAGISLSEAEASIAAPFTSKIQDISCVIKLLREGRAALTTTFQAFKFIELYSIIQFISVSLLYISKSNLSDNQFLYIDIGVLVPLCIFQSWTGAYYKLTKHLPQESLFSAPVLTSVLGSSAIQLFFQIFVYFQTEKQLQGEEYVACVQAKTVEADDPPCSQNTALFLISCQQYVLCCLTFSIAKPFRKPIWMNPLFFVSVLFMLSYQTYLFIHIDNWSLHAFQLLAMPDHYKYFLLVTFLLNGTLTYLYEKLFIGWYNRKYQEQQNDLKKMAFERMLVNGGASAGAQNQSTVDSNYQQFEGGDIAGSNSTQKLFSSSNIEHPLYLQTQMVEHGFEDDAFDNENDGWKNVMERCEDNTVK